MSLKMIHSCDNTVHKSISADNSLLKVLQINRLIDTFQGSRTRVTSTIRKFTPEQPKGVQSSVNKRSSDERKKIFEKLVVCADNLK